MEFYENAVVRTDLQSVCARVDWTRFRHKTILITGANGHIASYLAFSFLHAIGTGQLDARIVVMSRNRERLESLYRPFVGTAYFRIVVGDVGDAVDPGERMDFIFHFAGNASPYFIANDPVGILNANISGTFHVAELARTNPGSKIIFASTREVYGANVSDETLDEHAFGSLDPLDSRSCYPESKRAAEAVLEAYRKQYGVEFGIARIAHCYGPGMKLSDDGRVMSDLLDFALRGEDIILNSDGSALRAFCYITDAIVGLLLIASCERSDVFNLSNETEEIAIRDLARFIADRVSSVEVVVRKQQTDTGLYCAYKRKPLDCGKLVSLGWRPEMPLKEGISRTIESFIA